jgi:hypothetical protein
LFKRQKYEECELAVKNAVNKICAVKNVRLKSDYAVKIAVKNLLCGKMGKHAVKSGHRWKVLTATCGHSGHKMGKLRSQAVKNRFLGNSEYEYIVI